MSKKTIGLNPLEEYLSAPKRPQKEPAPVEPASKPLQELTSPILDENTVQVEQSVQQKIVEPQVDIDENVEVDEQGQFAIKGTKVPEEKKERPAKQRITLHISTELVDRIKNAVYWEPGLTVAGFAEEAFTDAIDTLEEERGEPFPQRKHHKLRGGRPVS